MPKKKFPLRLLLIIISLKITILAILFVPFLEPDFAIQCIDCPQPSKESIYQKIIQGSVLNYF